MDGQLAKEEPKQKRIVGLVSIKTLLKNPRRYGFIDNDHAHRYTRGMSRDVLVQVNTISDVDKGLVPADLPGAYEANNVQDREQGESSGGQRNVVDRLLPSSIQGNVCDKAAGKQPAISSSLSAQPASNKEQSSSFHHSQKPSCIGAEATQPQVAKPSQKKGSWRDLPPAADDPNDLLSQFYATGTYTINSRDARLSKVLNAPLPRGQPDIEDLGSRILAKMSLVPTTKVFPRQAAAQSTQAAPNQSTTASFGQPATVAHPPPPQSMSSGAAPSTLTASSAVSALSQPGTAPAGQYSLPLFQPPTMNATIPASFANSQANKGVSGQPSQHLPQGQANAGPSTTLPISTQSAFIHHAMPPSVARAISTNVVSRPASVSSVSGCEPTRSSRQVNLKKANTITWLTPESPATFAASRQGMLPPLRPGTLNSSQTTAHAPTDLGRPLPASSSGRPVTAPSVSASADPGRPLPTSTSRSAAPSMNASTNSGRPPPPHPPSSNETMATAPYMNASTNSGRSRSFSLYGEMVAAIAPRTETNSGHPPPTSSSSRPATTPFVNARTYLGRPLPASSASRLATEPAMGGPAPATLVSRRHSGTPFSGSRSSVANANQTVLPRSSLASYQTSSSSAGRCNTAPQLNTSIPGVSALSPATRAAILTADYSQDHAAMPPGELEQGVEAMDVDDQAKQQESTERPTRKQ